MWDKLPDEVKTELLDSEFSTRTHGKKSTYAQGCRGPLCRLAEREANNERYRNRVGSVKQYKSRRSLEYDKFLVNIRDWHWAEREGMRQGEDALEAYREMGVLT